MALILIVDDSPTEVFQMRRMLESHGFETEGAADGAEGIRKAREIRPDLILMDIVMPGVDGFRATRTLIGSLLLITLAAILFVVHWRWLKRRDDLPVTS